MLAVTARTITRDGGPRTWSSITSSRPTGAPARGDDRHVRRNTLKAVATYVGKPGTRELLRDVLVAQGWAGDDPDGAAESARRCFGSRWKPRA